MGRALPHQPTKSLEINQDNSSVALGTTIDQGNFLITLDLYYDKTTLTVTFHSNDGSNIKPQYVGRNGTVTEPTDPTRQDYDFAGWYADEGLTQPYNFDAPVTKDLDLYAKWTPRTDTLYTVHHYQQNTAKDGYTLKDTENLTGATGATVQAAAKTYPGFQ